RWRHIPPRQRRGRVVRSRASARARGRAGQRARSERSCDLERRADAAGGLRAARGRGGARRRRAGGLALARRRGPARADRPGRGVGRDSAPLGSGPVAYEFKLPDLGEGLTEGEIARWLVSEGQEVGEDDPLVEIQTDKTTVEIPSPAAGKIARILVGEGETVPVG